MSLIKISDLPAATSASAADVLPGVQSGVTRKVLVSALQAVPYDTLNFDTTPSATPLAEGQCRWNPAEKTLDIHVGGDVTLQVGRELLYWSKNGTVATIENGAVVMAAGADGNSGRINVALADGSVAANGFRIMGLATESIAANQAGNIAHFGSVRGVDTRGTAVGETWVAGDILYPHPTIPGALTKNEASAVIKLPLALVLFANANGTMFVRR